MWETICNAQAGFCTHSSNSKFLSKFSRKPLSGISDQKAPPPNEKLQILDDQSLLRNTPPNEKLQIWDYQNLLRNTSSPIGLQSWRSYVETNLYPPWIPLVESLREKSQSCLKVYSTQPNSIAVSKGVKILKNFFSEITE